ncbi:Glycoside hydrolase-type carbohydrate-binding [Diaporthe amygdali]|uniref:aldose epimerase family protein n=1 Tax=Phomopsis amygdali TaxID=1214568 RepID=UPI0022FE3D06|nr:aldose epimerase family protein [Diaporthe amygdali]KAJ0123852.1 Glycoside hydrolase-type carbohydrate-binding [Diaporthe amygdali]
MVGISAILTSLSAAATSWWDGGSPFAAYTALWPTDGEGKYIIEAEGIRMAFTAHNGGAPTNLWINDTNGNEVDIMLGLDKAEEYVNYTGILGGTLGRVTGPISGASFQINNKTYYTLPNSPDGKSTVDGGDMGWSRRPLDLVSHTQNSILFVKFDRAGKHGLPGTAASSIAHAVYPNEWRIAYGVTPSRTSDPIPINLSLMTFWNLDGFVSGSSGTVREHVLHMPFSGFRLEEDEHGIPTGDIKSNVKDSRHDFWSQPKAISEALDKKQEQDHEYDILHLINRQEPFDKDTSPVATLSSPLSGIIMDLYTDRAAVRLRTTGQMHLIIQNGSVKIMYCSGQND